MKKAKRISIIGIGGVGTYAAYSCGYLAEQMVIFNRKHSEADERINGLVRDLRDAFYDRRSFCLTGTDRFEDLRNSDFIVITIGLARQYPFETRDMLFFKNAALIKYYLKEIYAVSPSSNVIIASNPVDYMGMIAREVGFSEENIYCLGGELDTARLARFICDSMQETHQEPANPSQLEDLFVLGSHGPQMVPVFTYGRFKGKFLKDLLKPETMVEIARKTRSEGATITKKMGKSAVIGPGATIARIIMKMINNKRLLAHSFVKPDMLRRIGIPIDDMDGNLFLGLPFTINADKKVLGHVRMSKQETQELVTFIKSQADRDNKVKDVLAKTRGRFTKRQKIANFIEFMSQKGEIIRRLTDEGGYEIYTEGDDARNAVAIDVSKYI